MTRNSSQLIKQAGQAGQGDFWRKFFMTINFCQCTHRNDFHYLIKVFCTKIFHEISNWHESCVYSVTVTLYMYIHIPGGPRKFAHFSKIHFLEAYGG